MPKKVVSITLLTAGSAIILIYDISATENRFFFNYFPKFMMLQSPRNIGLHASMTPFQLERMFTS